MGLTWNQIPEWTPWRGTALLVLGLTPLIVMLVMDRRRAEEAIERYEQRGKAMSFEEFLTKTRGEWQFLITPTSSEVIITGWRCKEAPLPITGRGPKHPAVGGAGQTFLAAWNNFMKAMPEATLDELRRISDDS